MVHVLLKPVLENFEHYFTSVWDECSCAVVWALFGIAFRWDWNIIYICLVHTYTCRSTPAPKVLLCLCLIPCLHFTFPQWEPWLSAVSTHLLHLFNPTMHKQSCLRIAILILLCERSLLKIVQDVHTVLFFTDWGYVTQSIVFWSYLDQFCFSLVPCCSIVLFNGWDHMVFLFSFNFRIFLKLIDLVVLILLNMCSIEIFPHLKLSFRNVTYSSIAFSLCPTLLIHSFFRSLVSLFSDLFFLNFLLQK